MKIFAHRVNDWKPGNFSKCYGAEIDAQINDVGRVKAQHDPCGNQIPPIDVDIIIKHSGYDKFFVDIKQNMSIEFLKMIVEAFGDKLHALFDVPMPSAYFAMRAGLPIYQRLSEFEPCLGLGNKYWLDPLVSYTECKYEFLLSKILPGGKVIICSPELHGHKATEVWNWIEEKLQNKDSRIEGLVTKSPDRAMRFFKEHIKKEADA